MITDEIIMHWFKSERTYLQETQDENHALYQKHLMSIRHYRNVLTSALDTGYLNLHGIPKQDRTLLSSAYTAYRAAHLLPTVIISPTGRKHVVSIRLDFHTVEPDNASNLYVPALITDDKDLSLMLLLATEFSMATGHRGYINLRQVFIEDAEEVARQLLAFYNRQYEKHKAQVDALISSYQQRQSKEG